MKRVTFRDVGVCFVSLLMLMIPATIYAQAEQAKPGPPAVAQQLVREGTFAVKLEFALAVGTTEDEAEAESRLGEVGVAPRNGWIADYPVTPDIIGELQRAVGDAAEAGKLSLARDEALKRLNDVAVELGLPVIPHADGKTYEGKPAGAENYPDPTVINNYYYTEGPPVVTYYAPPPDYYYLYAWVPYPFWCFGFWFPGYFILNDFHRTVFVNRRVVFVSNHFNDVRVHRVFRIDPVSRFSGRTFAGIGAVRTRGFISTGVPRSERTIFNGPRARTMPRGRAFAPSSRGGMAPPFGGRRMAVPPAGGGRMATPPAGGRRGSFGQERR